MPKGKGEWQTPISRLKNREELWTKLENTGWSHPKLTSVKPITYFNNPLKWQWSAEYDRFFAYTKIFPLWDQEKTKENCQNLKIIRENIYTQEKNKPVPILTSFNYGRTERTPLDIAETSFRRIHAVADFNRRQGTMKVIERKPQ